MMSHKKKMQQGGDWKQQFGLASAGDEDNSDCGGNDRGSEIDFESVSSSRSNSQSMGSCRSEENLEGGESED